MLLRFTNDPNPRISTTMKLSFRHGIAVVAGTGLLAVGLAACGGTTDSGDSADTGSEVATSDIQDDGAALTCDDLSDEVWTLAPDPDVALSDMPAEDFTALATWMVDNGTDFEDEALGRSISEWGTLGPGYYEIDGETLPDEEAQYFETASESIDAACPGLGFGFE